MIRRCERLVVQMEGAVPRRVILHGRPYRVEGFQPGTASRGRLERHRRYDCPGAGALEPPCRLIIASPGMEPKEIFAFRDGTRWILKTPAPLEENQATSGGPKRHSLEVARRSS